MVKHSLSNIIILMTMLDVFVKTHLTAYDGDHGFVSNNHEKYFTNDLSSVHEEFRASVVRSSPLNNLNIKLVLKFDPEFLDFRERPLGVPYLERVTLFNTDSNKSIDMTSISGSTVHFHSSFFEDKRIPPRGNTSFNVVFLGRQEGLVESNLFIHTNEGHFRYKVKGASTSSPYRLRPLVGIKLPLNTTFSPFIHLYNPYMEPIQIVEMYSSGGDFHLELPTGELEGPKNIWEIPPLETKPIIRVRFHARMEQNHTAYIRIKLNNTEDILVVPLEVEVSSNTALYIPEGIIDFGIGGSIDPPKKINLNIHNVLKKPVRIHNITTSAKSIRIDYDNLKLPADTLSTSTPVKVATLTVDWKSAIESKEFSGNIVIYYRNGKSKLEIPYYVTVLEGGIAFNKSVTTYFINGSPKNTMSRNVVVRNDFPTPLALTNISLSPEARALFNVPDFKPVILQPFERSNIFTLNLRTNASVLNFNLRTSLLLKTNVSNVEIPILSYNGKVTVKFPYKSKGNSFNLGVITVDTKKDINFLIINTNPVYVNLRRISTSLPSGKVEIVGCGKGNYSNNFFMDSPVNLRECSGLAPDEFAVVKLSVHAAETEGQISADVAINTQFEQVSIPVKYKAAQGKLEIGPDRLVFDQCFPGKICSHPLRVHSTFNDPMVIENIVSMPPDPCLSTNHLGHIMARSTKIVGHLYLDPSVGCHNECYTGLNADDTGTWLQSLTLPRNLTAELDLSLVNSHYNRYLNETSGGFKKWKNLTMRLDTSEVKWHIFKTRVKMSWPSLIANENPGNRSVLKFPLTQVGNVSYYNITIRNPASRNLIVQLVLSSVYPGMDTLNDGLPPNLIPNRKYHRPVNEESFFFDEDCEIHRDAFKGTTNIDTHEESIPVLLEPNTNFTFVIGFRAENSILKHTFLYVRNNLTVIEMLQLNGQGAVPNFKFGNRKPGSNQHLSFELAENQLRECEHKKYPSPNLTIRRTFSARNLGEIPVFIQGFLINGKSCEGYGFKVLNCSPFVLLPNSTKKVDIAFTPDLSLAKVVRTLTLQTSLNIPVSYILIATIPPSYLIPCSTALARPPWEPYLYYTSISSMSVLLVFIVALVIIETEHSLKEIEVYVKKRGTTQSTLDLKLVGIQTRAEIHSHKNEEAAQKEKPKTPESKQEVEVSTSEVPVKPEPEKYTVLIPTTGKSKRKLTKKNSNDSTGSEIHGKCDGLHKHKTKTVENKVPEKHTVPELDVTVVPKKVVDLKDTKRKFQLRKTNVKTSPIPNVEEETSSTTTESSNNEETDKDCNKIKKPRVKRSPIPKEVSVSPLVVVPKPQQAMQVTTVEASIPPVIIATTVAPVVTSVTTITSAIITTKVETKKIVPKVIQKTKEKDKEVQDKSEIKSWEFKPKGNSKNNLKERKIDKQNVMKKSPVEKKSIEHWCNTVTTVTRASPTSQPNGGVWGENKATFSDVVARNDAITPLAVVPPRSQSYSITNNKPTMYVEPYKQVTGNLGPIGSRKSNYHRHDNHANLHDHQFNQLSSSSSNSFFSDGHDLNLDGLNFGENWDPQHQRNIASQFSRNNMRANSNSFLQQDPWCWQNSNASPESMWDTNRIGSYGNEGLTNHASLNHENDYLWGSSSVWQPWSPLETRRMPPGFVNSHNHSEVEERPDRNQTYDLFGMTNIWAQQYPNPWNYPQGQFYDRGVLFSKFAPTLTVMDWTVPE